MRVSSTLTIPDEEIELVAVRAQGPGGQNVNKVSTAIHLFLNIANSSLPEASKQRLLEWNDSRISSDGKIVIKAQSSRSQEKNKEEACERLKTLLLSALAERKKRRPTKPKAGARQKRLDHKKQHSGNKALRRKILP